MIAIGMASYEIDETLAELHDVIIDRGNPKGSVERWSAAENFFDGPDAAANRVFLPEKNGKERSNYNWENRPEVLAFLKKWGRGFLANVAHQYFFPITNQMRRSYSIVKRLLLIGDLRSGMQGSLAPSYMPPFVTPVARPTEFQHHDNAATYLHSLLLNRGLFSGYAAREFFRNLMKKHLVTAHFKAHKGAVPLDPDMSFMEFYNVTGVDLVVTGVNISRREPRYFSVWHTPDFPVVEAVALSMSIPLVFKPVYIGGGVRKGDDAHNAAYQGLYVDGGMLNNYPVRAFDTIAKRSTLSTGEPLCYRNADVSTFGGVFLSVDPKEGTGGNEPFLGFRLVDLGDVNVQPDKDQADAPSTKFDVLFPKDGNAKVGIDLIKDLYFTCMYPASAGQIQYANDRSRTIPLNVHGLDVLDFAHPNADFLNKRVTGNGESRGQFKVDRRNEAQKRVEKRVVS